MNFLGNTWWLWMIGGFMSVAIGLGLHLSNAVKVRRGFAAAKNVVVCMPDQQQYIRLQPFVRPVLTLAFSTELSPGS